ncbi:MAG: crossover junction endodeoxyribonuclease RuvC [Phycisphaeraceae bacterium]
MRVLGIDPGLRITGYACVELPPSGIEPKLLEAGVLTFKPQTPTETRLLQLHTDLTALIAELHPTRLAVEKLYAHYAHPRTAILMAHARGIILLAGSQAQLPITHLASTEVKKSLTGNGHASKQQIQLAVASQCRLAEPPNPPDVADAIAIALTCARRIAFERL